MKLLCATLGLLFLALPASADTIYDVNATATITGNDACGGPCIETMSISLRLDQVDPFNTNVMPGGTFTSSGPIPYGSGSILAGPEQQAMSYIPFGFGGDELDLSLGCAGSPFPCTPGIYYGQLWSCGDMTCVNDFCPDNCSGFIAPNYYGGIASGPLVGTIRAETPEPSSLALLSLSLLGLAVLMGIGRMRSGWRFHPRGLRAG